MGGEWEFWLVFFFVLGQLRLGHIRYRVYPLGDCPPQCRLGIIDFQRGLGLCPLGILRESNKIFFLNIEAILLSVGINVWITTNECILIN